MKGISELPVTVYGVTDKGMVREKNEDSFFAISIEPEDRDIFGVRASLVVADGMGGHVGGDLASSAVVRRVGEVLLDADKGGLSIYGEEVGTGVLNLIRAADRDVRALGTGEEKPPGTTVTSAFIVGNRATIGHVGDSRAYLIREREIRVLTEDHSLVGKLIKEGKLTPQEAQNFPHKNIILKSLGGREALEIDSTTEIELIRGDVLLLCSDGLWGLVTDEEILSHIHADKKIDIALDRLVGLANSRGGTDNITIAAAEFGMLKRDKRIGQRDFKIDDHTSEGLFSNAVFRGLFFVLLALMIILSVIFGLQLKEFLKEGDGGGGGRGREGVEEVQGEVQGRPVYSETDRLSDKEDWLKTPEDNGYYGESGDGKRIR